MKRIEISVQNRVAWQTNSVDYICGNGDFAIGFVFDSEWDKYESKTARFIYNGEHADIVFTGTECKIPKILGAKRMEVGVYAGDLYTTTPALVQCRKSILCDSGTPVDPTQDVYEQIMEQLNNGFAEEQIARAVADYMKENPIDTGSKVTNGDVELLAANWVTESEEKHSQVVTIDGVTKNSQVDLTPTEDQLIIWRQKELAFTTKNIGGVVTVYAIGQKPENDYTIQVTITEVEE